MHGHVYTYSVNSVKTSSGYFTPSEFCLFVCFFLSFVLVFLSFLMSFLDVFLGYLPCIFFFLCVEFQKKEKLCSRFALLTVVSLCVLVIYY